MAELCAASSGARWRVGSSPPAHSTTWRDPKADRRKRQRQLTNKSLCRGDPSSVNRRQALTPDGNAHPTVEDLTCDPTLFQGSSSPTMSFPTTQPSTESCPNCKAHIQ